MKYFLFYRWFNIFAQYCTYIYTYIDKTIHNGRKDSRKKEQACARVCELVGRKKEKANWLLACACRKVYGYGWDLPC